MCGSVRLGFKALLNSVCYSYKFFMVIMKSSGTAKSRLVNDSLLDKGYLYLTVRNNIFKKFMLLLRNRYLILYFDYPKRGYHMIKLISTIGLAAGLLIVNSSLTQAQQNLTIPTTPDDTSTPVDIYDKIDNQCIFFNKIVFSVGNARYDKKYFYDL